MRCYNCGCNLSELDYCTACGADVVGYKKIMYTANRLYNEGLDRACVRDLSGAIRCLKECLRFNKDHIDARNLLGLVYYEMGESIQALCEWIISKNLRPEKNVADDYINIIQSNQGRIDTINSTINKYNVALDLARKDNLDMAVIQLKKVLSLNPKYARAHLLLALIYIQREEWKHAKRELERYQDIDNGNVDCLLYMREVDAVLSGDEEDKGKGKKKKKDDADEKTAVYKTSGNELIIQPLNERENISLVGFLQIALGLLVGMLVSYFIIVPGRLSAAQEQANIEIASYGEQIDSKNAELIDANNRISQLEQKNVDLQATLDSLSGADGTVDADNYLMAAAYAHMTQSGNDMEVEEYLAKITENYVTENASEEFIDLYQYLRGQIGETVAAGFYTSGMEAYNQMDYVTAINDLQKAYRYDPEDDDALYYLGVAYYDSGDVISAADCFESLLSIFPGSAQAQKASQRLAEINQ